MVKRSLLLSLLLSAFFVTPDLLAQQQGQGWLEFETSATDSFFVVIDDDFENKRMITAELRVPVEAGDHKVALIFREYDDMFRNVSITQGETETLTFEPSKEEYRPYTSWNYLKFNKNVIVKTDRHSVIYIDGNKVDTAYTEQLLSPGEHDLRVWHKDFGVLKKKLNVDYGSGISLTRYNENPAGPTTFDYYLPGVAYLNKKEYVKASITYAALAGLTTGFILTNREYLDAKHYPSGTIVQQKNKEERLSRNRTIYAAGIIAVYLYSTFDGLRKPKEGYLGKPVEFEFAGNTFDSQLYPELTLTYRFRNN